VSIKRIEKSERQEKKRKITQAAIYSLHQFRKKRQTGPKCHESLPPKENRPKEKIKLVGIVASGDNS
jgi:hypothetical protein